MDGHRRRKEKRAMGARSPNEGPVVCHQACRAFRNYCKVDKCDYCCVIIGQWWAATMGRVFGHSMELQNFNWIKWWHAVEFQKVLLGNLIKILLWNNFDGMMWFNCWKIKFFIGLRIAGTVTVCRHTSWMCYDMWYRKYILERRRMWLEMLYILFSIPDPMCRFFSDTAVITSLGSYGSVICFY